MPVNINYAPVAALGTTGYAAGLGQYRQWQQEEAMKQQQMLLQSALEQEKLQAQQQATQANITMSAPLRQAQAAYYQDRGNYYGARSTPDTQTPLEVGKYYRGLFGKMGQQDDATAPPKATVAPGGAQVQPGSPQLTPAQPTAGPQGPQLTPSQIEAIMLKVGGPRQPLDPNGQYGE